MQGDIIQNGLPWLHTHIYTYIHTYAQTTNLTLAVMNYFVLRELLQCCFPHFFKSFPRKPWGHWHRRTIVLQFWLRGWWLVKMEGVPRRDSFWIWYVSDPVSFCRCLETNISRIHSPKHILSQWFSYISQVGYIFSTTLRWRVVQLHVAPSTLGLGLAQFAFRTPSFGPCLPSWLWRSGEVWTVRVGWMDGWKVEKNPWGFMGFLGLFVRSGIYPDHLLFYYNRWDEMVRNGAFWCRSWNITGKQWMCFQVLQERLGSEKLRSRNSRRVSWLVSDTVVICPPRVQFSEDFVRAEGGGLGMKYPFKGCNIPKTTKHGVEWSVFWD